MRSSTSVTTLTLAAAALLILLADVDARPTFVQRIPNGASVPGVRALGHVNPNGGGANNAFGEAFHTAGTQWTAAVCHADSDGDGATNGEELGDPCCTWRQGSAASRSQSITHPGVANAFSSRDLAAMRCEATEQVPNPQATEPAVIGAPTPLVGASEGTPSPALSPGAAVTNATTPRPAKELAKATPTPTSGASTANHLGSVSSTIMLLVAGSGVWLASGQ